MLKNDPKDTKTYVDKVVRLESITFAQTGFKPRNLTEKSKSNLEIEQKNYSSMRNPFLPWLYKTTANKATEDVNMKDVARGTANRKIAPLLIKFCSEIVDF